MLLFAAPAMAELPAGVEQRVYESRRVNGAAPVVRDESPLGRGGGHGFGDELDRLFSAPAEDVVLRRRAPTRPPAAGARRF